LPESAKSELLQMANDTLNNVAYAFSKAVAGNKDAENWA
jgi:hypothetical protein